MATDFKKKMSAITIHRTNTIHTTKSMSIPVAKPNVVSNTVGTCRSYDEKQPIPSFIRSLRDHHRSKSKKGAKFLIYDELSE